MTGEARELEMGVLREPAGAVWRWNADESVVVVSGAWVLGNIEALLASMGAEPKRDHPYRIDASAITALDSAGALCLVRSVRRNGRTWNEQRIDGLDHAHERLLDLVATGLEAPKVVHKSRNPFVEVVEQIGARTAQSVKRLRDLIGFVGRVMATLAATLIGRHKLRFTSIVFHMEKAGFDAVPIVALLSFSIGAVVAFLGATVLRDFGAEVYTVELVGFAVLREFAVLLTAILLAGRSGSAFTAQIGSMKSREEIDAISTLGLDPVALLVIPRLFALLVMLPVLTFVAMLAGIFGGGIVGTLSLDLTSAMFLSRLRETMEMRHILVGLGNAPVFAFIIAVVGCHEGLRVRGSAESVGRHTTSSVVQSIFFVIIADALFAIWFMEMGW